MDQHGQAIDILVSQRRDIASSGRFFTTALARHRTPAEVITDPAPDLANAIDELMPAAFHTCQSSSFDLTNLPRKHFGSPPARPQSRDSTGNRSRCRLANRNCIIHQYNEVNRETTWLTPSRDLPEWMSSLQPLFN